MGDKPPRKKNFDALRRRAEAFLDAALPEHSKGEGIGEARELVYELQVHQVELELQNDELRRARQEAEELHNRYQDLYDFAPVGYLILQEKGRIREMNLAAAALLHGAREDLVGTEFTRFICPEDQDIFYFHRKELLQGRTPQTCELRLKAIDPQVSEPVHVLLKSAIMGTSKAFETIRVSLTDISLLKRAEEELQRAHDRLETRVRERTAELADLNEALRIEIVERERAQRGLTDYAKILESKNREMQEFVFVASHDLQEPLRKIQVFGSLLKREEGSPMDEKQRDFLERMRLAAERMRNMIDALLEFSRITTRGKPFTELDLSEPVKKALQLLDLMVEETGAEVEIGHLPVIEADHSQMVQLFENLLGNALKFRRNGDSLRVKIHAQKAGNGWIRLLVEDNGIGFEEQYAQRIFNPFERLHGKMDFKGTGIGLSICRKVVERHGGMITAKSTPGKGSTFIIDLPVKQDQSERQNRPVTS